MRTGIAQSLVLLSILFAAVGQAEPKQVFSVAPDRIREIALEAAYERYPDIPVGSLEDERGNNYLQIHCRSALESGIVTNESEDFDHCVSTRTFRIIETIQTRKYMDDEGACIEEIRAEEFQVYVFSDGSTMVGPRWFGGGGHSEECTEEFEGWLE